MINISKLTKQLMRKNKSELLKLLRKEGKKADLHIAELKQLNLYDFLPIQTRDLIDTWLNPKTGKFWKSPKKATKQQIVQMIINAYGGQSVQKPKIEFFEERENETDEEREKRYKQWEKDNGKIPERLRRVAGNFIEWYDPSEFWGIYWTQYRDSYSTNEFWEYGIELASKCESREEFYAKLMNGGSDWL